MLQGVKIVANLQNLNKKYSRLNLQQFTLPEIEIIKELANFNEIQTKVFDLSCAGNTIVEISLEIPCSVETVNKTLKQIRHKIFKLFMLNKLYI